ncbi:putative diguanylate cyclase YcdT [Acaryochloris thomasi RCC1774]|uniref:Putative diguanylate cyclase YcdT n=1 Tax=Acaryochloris thomasi RCC1774 TaxID=1764569 RepID=A0A2W1JFG4_9CYAN|nr:diguanylate cyclase [Acaryochloris thomasi]PZD72399.1 putative diguanylate cyclase YcdT [Acaryochloris thomasi RCC1774]
MKLFNPASLFTHLPYRGKELDEATDSENTDIRITRSLTTAYTVALSLIALLSIGAHLLLDNVIKENVSSAKVINVAGRQRMLSQRISIYATALEQGNIDLKPEFLKLTTLMEQSHKALVYGNGKLDLTHKLTPELRQLYFSEPDALDRRTRTFIKNTKILANSTDSNQRQEAYKKIQAASLKHLLPMLDEAVFLFESDTTERTMRLRNVQQAMLVILLMALSLEAAFIFRPMVHRVKEATFKLYNLAMHDALTELYNRRHFMETGRRELLLAQRRQQPATLLMIDIDHFKRINDTYGHATGDAVLKKFAIVLLQALRQTDIIGRIGGEEFAIILPDCDAPSSQSVAERIRATMAETRLRNPSDLSWTVSIGIAILDEGTDNLDSLMQKADAALYRAKESGRNQVVIS